MVSPLKSIQIGTHLFCTAAPDLTPDTILASGSYGRRLCEQVVVRLEKLTEADAIRKYFETAWGRIPSDFDITRPRSVQMSTAATLGVMHEMILEVVRLREFSHCPSRLDCLFLWETEANARDFHSRRPWPTGLYEVEVIGYERVLVADMNIISWCHPEETAFSLMERAQRYWEGYPADSIDRSGEVLLEGQVRIHRSFSDN